MQWIGVTTVETDAERERLRSLVARLSDQELSRPSDLLPGQVGTER